MRIGFTGDLRDEPEIRVGFIGCGSHAFRNVYPTFQFAPVSLAATCDLAPGKAEAFARKFGAPHWYTDFRAMLAQEKLDAVFIVTSYDAQGRPNYPDLACACLEAGCHVWMEKPPAATCAEIERMRAAAAKANRQVLVGMKKMFFPANEKARELMASEGFGRPMLISLQYPQWIPTTDDMHRYLHGRENVRSVVWFLDHLCHPTSLLVYLAGLPRTLYYERAASGAGVATFGYENGLVATLQLTHGTSRNGGMERTLIVGENDHHIVVDNNRTVSYHRTPMVWNYGGETSFYRGTPDQATAVWEPEFSLGQLYNKGLFMLGYYGEVKEFAAAILEKRPLSKCTLDDAWKVTRIFEAFAEGPGKVISLT